MSTEIKRRRGTTAQHSTFTGAAGELTVDTDKKVVVVHDGATAGGNPMAPAASPTFTGTVTVAKSVSSITALTDDTTIALDFSLGNNFSVTLGGNRTLGNPTNLTPGQSGSIFISQDATGSRLLSYGNYWKFPTGTVPVLSTAASSIDRLDFIVMSSTVIHAVVSKGYA